MREEFKGYTPQTFSQDLLAGITVGIVALPLALAFGVTSGAGAAAGVFTAIVAGLVAAVFGGSRLNVTGPTGAMTVVLIPIIAQYGLDKIFLVAAMAGVLLIIMGLLRLGRLIQLIPWPVVTGFTNGIAIIIFLQQVPGFLGVSTPPGHGILPVTWEAVQGYLEAPQIQTLLLGVITAFIMVLWPRFSKRIPSSMVALLVATLISLSMQVPRIGDIPRSLPQLGFPLFDLGVISTLFSAALAVALLGGIESLLSAVVADGMRNRERHDPDRELVGQGLANIAAPLFGGIPATGAIARTAVNVRSGAITRMAAIVHAVFLLLVVWLLGPYAAQIPNAVLAGILMVTALRMIEVESVKALFRSTKSDLSTMLITTGVTVFFDLILAIEVGLVVAGILFIQRMRTTVNLEATDISHETPEHLLENRELLKERVMAFEVEGPLFFAVASEFLETLLRVADVDVLILRMGEVKVIDASGANALKTIKEALERRGVKLLIANLPEQPKNLLAKMGLLNEITLDGKHLFESTDAALEHAWSHVQHNHTKAQNPTE